MSVYIPVCKCAYGCVCVHSVYVCMCTVCVHACVCIYGYTFSCPYSHMYIEDRGQLSDVMFKWPSTLILEMSSSLS